MKEWIAPGYLKPETRVQVKEGFVTNWSIELPSFLKEEKFDSLREELTSGGKDVNGWHLKGPASQCHYQQGGRGPLTTSLMELLASEAWKAFIFDVTGLETVEGLDPNLD